MRKLGRLAVRLLSVPFLVMLGGLGCNGNDEPYKVSPAWSGKHASLPAVPQLPTSPVKVGDSFTVYGAIHHLKSRIHSAEVTTKDISITGYIVDSNIPTAPACAVHPTGKKDPDGCVTDIPTFWISDSKTDKAG